MNDPFDTAALRAAVLRSWADSPTRFREDANAEEDLVLGGYAGAWFVELAQNAADAGARRVRVAVVDGELRVANDGAPLTADGVAALASLRASAKRDDEGSVGRFGVGFAAVLPISAEPRIVSTSGGVAFSAARTREEVAEIPVAAAELARRDEPPVLRLVWPTDEEPPAEGTEVRLPLRPGVDAQQLVEQAAALAPDLLLALRGLTEIEVAGTVVRRVDDGDVVTVGDRRWRLARAAGELADTDRDRAAEQRTRARWTVTWALPVDAEGRPVPLGEDVAHAPTATTERLALPARLIASLPLEADRRRVRPGRALDVVLEGAVAAYVDLVAATPPEHRLTLVPEAGFPRSPLDGRLHELLLAGLRTAAWLPAPRGELAPGRAEWLDVPGASPRLVELLADAGLDRIVTPVADPAPLTELGVRRIGPAELVERLFGPEQPLAWWAELYTELTGPAEAVPGLVEDLRALPVPLAGDRVAAGPATVFLPPDEHDAPVVGPLARLGLPGLHVAALAHPLLERLGARPAEASALLAHPALVEAVERSLDDAEAGLDPLPLAEAVLALVERTGEAPEAFRALALPDEDGRPARADELMLPDAALRPLLADDVPIDVIDPELAARVPRAALVAVGVLDGFTVVVDEEPTGPDHDLDGEDEWWDAADEPPARLVAVRDLDLVADDAWPGALALIADDRDARAAVFVPGGYTAWWLSRHARLGGRRPDHWRLASAHEIAGLYDAVPADLDEELLAAIGVRSGLVVADRESADDLLDRLADPTRTPDAALTSAAHAALAEAVAAGRVAADDLALPDRVRALDGSVVDVEVAVVLDEPWPAAVLPAGELVIGGDPQALAELLDLPLATDVVAGAVDSTGTPTPWRALAEVVVTCDTLGVEVPEGELVLHDELWVQLTRPEPARRRVPVWRDGATWHAEDPVRALLALLAA
ncbi:sacsin N-terminal ATP-binding-like domain-containing protein [Pseudonocardia thermophila]|uniref:sacsin N-terminal ATP-binding-like domain-containing protein n=1 Tax=Pseudonocardia thermophila TaxID=1848 RepID=UPI0009361B3E